MSAAARLPMSRLVDLLLTRDPRQRIRLSQAALASMLMLLCICCLLAGVALGVVPPDGGIRTWAVVSIAGFVSVGIAIRSGLTLRLKDPSLTSFQMVYAIGCAAFGYAVSGPAHVIAPLTLAVIFMFGMFGMTTRQVVGVAIYALVLFSGVAAWSSVHDPVTYDPRVDGLVFFVLATMTAGVVALTRRLHGMRDRLRERSIALQEAVAKIERLATHDDLTGLVNRRHMQQLLQDEHARGLRDRHPWCVALIDVDHFKRINDQHGHAVGDEVLRALGQRAVSLIRRTDTLGRWGGEEFVLLLPHTAQPAAHLSIDRVREYFHRNPLEVGAARLDLSFSAGVTEHRAGESVAQTLERADQLAYVAKQQGRNRVVAG